MVALLVVTRGPIAGTKFPIEGAVCRVGSSAGMTIRVAELEAHAITLQQRGSESYVFNRGSRSIRVGDTELAPAASTIWPLGVDIEFSGGVAFQLANGDTPLAKSTATRAVASRSGIPTSDSSEEQTSVKTNRSRQTAIIATFFVLFGGYLLIEASGSISGTTAKFHVLIEDLMAAPHDPRLRTIRRGLQHAYNLETLEYTDEAVDEYVMLRQFLTIQRPADDPLFGSSKIRDLEDRSLAFLRDHLERLRYTNRG